ncbi:MAG: ArnT family glycosyltransferase [Acidimicrobiales bacterium]
MAPIRSTAKVSARTETGPFPDISSQGAPRRARALTFWVSPEDQPAWARPVLLGLAALAAVLFTWRAGTYLELYYAAAVRSMSLSWHNFFFAALDPAGTITLDKLPGAFWIQALFVRAFGVHTWAILFPQVLEGVMSVLVFYRIVRRLCGTVAAMTAAAIFTLSPATVSLNRGNISDTLMVLLLLLASAATIAGITSGRWRPMLLAGLWVGLAFQAKMIEAWLVLPALGIAYLIAAPGGRLQRLGRVVAMGAVTVLVSLSWMTVVSLTPASSRPYVDGSQNNSVFQQVFSYNGFGRLDQLSPDQLLTQSIGVRIPPPPPASWNRLLTGPFGRDIGWLLPAALIMLVVGLAVTWRNPRRDLARASFVIWGTWLITFATIFSISSSINSYYTAALSPPIAGLIASGAVLLWKMRDSIRARLAVAIVVASTVGYSVWLLPAYGTGRPGWLVPVMIAVGAAAVTAILLSSLKVAGAVLLPAGVSASIVAVLLVPTVASVSIASSRLGPFDTPFQSEAVTTGVRQFFDITSATSNLIPALERARQGAPFLMATQTSALASPFIYVSGQEVLPIGGFTGTIPEPSLSAMRTMIRAGDFHLVLQSPSTTDPRLVWIAHHCIPVPPPKGVGVPSAPSYAIYYCLRNS